jgi:carbonic anhydrase/acetyltransferase-like protein (isoleucine patch superfamily)
MGIEANAAGHYPDIAPTAHVHPTATVVGRVRIAERVFVGPHAVIRADEAGPDGDIEPIVIGESANVQDCVVIHALGGTGVTIGRRTSIAHGAVVHGPCEIGDDCFVGFNSVVFYAQLGNGVVVMHQSLVERARVPEDRLVPSMTAVRCDYEASHLKRVPPEIVAFVEKVVGANSLLVQAASRPIADAMPEGKSPPRSPGPVFALDNGRGEGHHRRREDRCRNRVG